VIPAIRLMFLRRRQRRLQREMTEARAVLADAQARLYTLARAEQATAREINKHELTMGRIACP
jgi:hypothetical protein